MSLTTSREWSCYTWPAPGKMESLGQEDIFWLYVYSLSLNAIPPSLETKILFIGPTPLPQNYVGFLQYLPYLLTFSFLFWYQYLRAKYVSQSFWNTLQSKQTARMVCYINKWETLREWQQADSVTVCRVGPSFCWHENR